MGDPFEGLFDSGEVLERVGVNLTTQARRGDLDLILFVDELPNLIGQGTALGAAMDAANMLKPALVRGDIRIIGATTGGEYDKWIRGDPALERRFQPVLVEELDAIQTWEVLVARRPRLERHHAVALTDDALKAAIGLTDRFVPERARPDKAIDVVDEACAHAQATARVSPELDRLIRERRKVDAMIRRGLTTAPGVAEPAPDLVQVIDQVVADFREVLGGQPARRTGGQGAPGAPEPTDRPTARPPDRPLEERRTELDSLLRAELELQGIVVTGREVARVVSAAVGKGIEWARWRSAG